MDTKTAAAPAVRIDVDGPIATLLVDRPAVLNALDSGVLGELQGAIARLAGDRTLRGVIVTGAGPKAFVAGADIQELTALNGQGGYRASRRGQDVFRDLESLPVPTVAAVNGYALGGGLELALACTMRIAAEGARLGLPEVSLGLIPGYGGTQRLARLIGTGRALELILTGEPVTAEEAHRLGIVNRVVPAAELLAAARTLLTTIASRGPLAVAAALDVVRSGVDASLDAGLELEAQAFGRLCASDDMHEGTSAFLGKRKPSFAGR